MAIWKTLSLLAIFVLSVLQLRQEKPIIKWIAVGLCALVFIQGVYEFVYSEQAQEAFEAEVLRDATRIDWKKTEVVFKLINDIEEVPKGSQQVILKIFPMNVNSIGGVSMSEVLKRTSRRGGKTEYVDENDASRLWYSMAEQDGMIYVQKELDKGVEHINFYEHSLERDNFMGTDSFQNMAHVPRVGSKYSSLHDLKNTIIVARMSTGIQGGAYISGAYVNFSTRAGIASYAFQANQIKNNAAAVAPVRYVGIVIR